VPELEFALEGAEAVPFAASPLLQFNLRIENRAPEPIHTIILRCQIQLEVARRHYSEGEQSRLVELFGPPELWGRTLRGMLWTNTSVVVPAFTGSTVVGLPVPCTFDFNVAATKYFAGLERGEAPVCLLFSGTIFYDEGGALRVGQIPWEKEINYRLPVAVWKRMMDVYYPDTAWLCLRRDVFDRLYEHKMRRGVPAWEDVIAQLLSADAERGAARAEGR
jgi:hypothetical protein